MTERMMSKRLAGVLLSLIFAFVAGGLSPLFAADSKNVLKLYNEAVELQNEENWYTASQYFIEVVNSNPAFSDAWFRLADCSYHLGEFDLAFQYLESAEKYESNKPEIKNLKGMILLALGRTDEARSIFNEILKKYPQTL